MIDAKINYLVLLKLLSIHASFTDYFLKKLRDPTFAPNPKILSVILLYKKKKESGLLKPDSFLKPKPTHYEN